MRRCAASSTTGRPRASPRGSASSPPRSPISAALPRTGLDPATLTSLAVADQRLPHRARRHGAALWRRDDRRLAQHALCGDPECRRLARRAADCSTATSRCATRADAGGVSRRGCRRWRRSSMARPSGSAARATRGWCRPPSCSTRRSPGMTGTSGQRGDCRRPADRPARAQGRGDPGRLDRGAPPRSPAPRSSPRSSASSPNLRAQRAVATDAAGLGTRPHGPEWYAWGLRAGTTTRRTPGRHPRAGSRAARRSTGADGRDPARARA